MEQKTVGFVLFDAFHQRQGTAGSRIQGDWLIKYWPESERFIQGKDYKTVIYQKAYWKEHARAFKGKKILSICDPDWMDGVPVADFASYMDAVVVPTEPLAEAIRQFCDKPVFVVPDRIDLETLPPKKELSDEPARSVVWFGYAHNATVLDGCLTLLKKLGLKLIVISNGNYATQECEVENIRWSEETANLDIQKGDIALLPQGLGARFRYKSNNKETLALALGLPVAKTPEELKRFLDPKERKKEMDEKYQRIIEEYDVRKSVREMQSIVAKI